MISSPVVVSVALLPASVAADVAVVAGSHIVADSAAVDVVWAGLWPVVGHHIVLRVVVRLLVAVRHHIAPVAGRHFACAEAWLPRVRMPCLNGETACLIGAGLNQGRHLMGDHERRRELKFSTNKAISLKLS